MISSLRKHVGLYDLPIFVIFLKSAYFRNKGGIFSYYEKNVVEVDKTRTMEHFL